MLPWGALSEIDGSPRSGSSTRATNTVSLRPIVVDAYLKDRIIVTSGLNTGDIVVTAGGQFLRPAAEGRDRRRADGNERPSAQLRLSEPSGCRSPLRRCGDDKAAPSDVRPVLSVVAHGAPPRPSGRSPAISSRATRSRSAFRCSDASARRDVNVGDVVTKGARSLPSTPRYRRSQSAPRRRRSPARRPSLQPCSRPRSVSARCSISGSSPRRNSTSPSRTARRRPRTSPRPRTSSQRRRTSSAIPSSTSTVDGVVTARSAEVGQIVAAGQTVVTVARPDVREAVFDVPDAIATALPPAAAFTVIWELNPSFSTSAGCARSRPKPIRPRERAVYG